MLKKVLALFTALVLVFSMGAVTVFAEGEVEGEGETKYVKTDEFAVILPTANNWIFYLDPQGLIGAKAAGLFDGGQVATEGQLEPFAGKIISGSYAPVAVNLSSYEMTLGVALKVIGDDIITVDSDTAFTDQKNEIVLNALLAENFATAGTPFATSASTVAVPLDKTGKTLGFVLEAPEYVFAATSGNAVGYEYKLGTGEEGYGTQLQLGGLVNKSADWSAYAPTTGDGGVTVPAAKKVSIDAKFTLTKSLPAELAAAKIPNAYGYIGPLSGTPGGGGVGFPGTTKTVPISTTVKTAQTVSFTFPSGTNASGVAIYSPSNATLTSNDYTLNISQNTITFSATRVTTITNSTGSKAYKITVGSTDYILTFNVT